MDVGEDVIVWVMTSLVFFIAMIAIIMGSDAISLKVNTMYEDAMKGIYATYLVDSVEDSFTQSLPMDFNCRDFVYYIFYNPQLEEKPYPRTDRDIAMPHSSHYDRNLVWVKTELQDYDGWKMSDMTMPAVLIVRKDCYYVAHPRFIFYSWDGFCRALLSSYSGREKVGDCDCEIEFFGSKSRECAHYNGGMVCAHTEIPVEDGNFILRKQTLYALSDGNRIWFRVEK